MSEKPISQAREERKEKLHKPILGFKDTITAMATEFEILTPQLEIDKVIRHCLEKTTHSLQWTHNQL
jgi:hypothetical protein